VAAASAALAITASLGVLAPWFLFVFKPLTTLLLIARAGRAGSIGPTLRRWVIVGLVLSLVGNVALLWPKQGLLPGLIAFLLAQLAFIRAFGVSLRFGTRPAVFVLYGVVAAPAGGRPVDSGELLAGAGLHRWFVAEQRASPQDGNAVASLTHRVRGGITPGTPCSLPKTSSRAAQTTCPATSASSSRT
jgi:hypothetical protein